MKQIELQGYGTVMVSPISVKEQEFETCDANGQPLTKEVVGTRAKTVWRTGEGAEVPNSHVCKKLVVDGEEIVTAKFKPLTQIESDSIKEISDNGLIYRAIQRKLYSVATDSKRLRELVLKHNKSLEFPLVVGNGWKIWNGILTNWNGKLLLVGCRGDIKKELDKYGDDMVEFEIESIPQQQNIKKLVKAIAVV